MKRLAIKRNEGLKIFNFFKYVSCLKGMGFCDRSENSDMTETKFVEVAIKTLEGIHNKLDEYNLTNLELHDSVLEFSIDEKNWIINLQRPNKQIWFSSPITGPQRYEYNKNTWLEVRSKRDLEIVVISEIKSLIKI